MKNVIIAALASAGMFGLLFAGVSHSQPPGGGTGGSPVVLVEGIGTGFHIGKGLYVTAGHVADALKDKPGIGYDILWRGVKDDIALLKSKSPVHPSAKLAIQCSPVEIGTHVRIEGFPLDIGRSITYGRVATAPYDTERDPEGLKQALAITVAPGNSGAPVIQDVTIGGGVVGVLIEMRVIPLGFGASLTGFAQMVPSTVLCDHLGRS